MEERRRPVRLTETQLKVLAAVEDLSERGWAPTYREILERLGWSPKSKGALHQYLQALAELGLLAGRGRSLRLLPQGSRNDRSEENAPARGAHGITVSDGGGAAAERRPRRHGRSLGRERTGARPTQPTQTHRTNGEAETMQGSRVDPSEELPDLTALFQALLESFRRAPRHSLPPAEHITWWDRGVREGIETAMIYGEQALRAVAAAARAGNLEKARLYAGIFEPIFATHDLPRGADGRVEKTSLIVDGEQLIIPLAGPNPRLLDALTAAASDALGQPGRKLSTSPAEYLREHPDNVVLLRANVCVHPPLKIWDGDLDLTLDETTLQDLASKLDRQVYVLHKSDWRPDGGHGEGSLEGAVYVANPDGTCILGAALRVGEDGLLHPRP